MIAPSGKGILLLTIDAIFTSLAIAAYVARFTKNLSKARTGLLLWKDFLLIDALVLVTTVLVIVNCALRIVSVLLGGVGWDTEDLTDDQVQWALKALFVEEITWTTSLCLLKFALIILYGRIFISGTGKKYRRIVQWIAHAVVGCLFVGSIVYYLAHCTPIPAAWTPGLGKCASPRAGWIGTEIANLITDVIIFSVPAVWLADLQMNLHNKAIACIQLFLGVIVSIVSFTRIFFVVKVDPANITGSVVNADILSCIELTMAIVFASLAGIAGREATSKFVDRFIVPRPRTQYAGKGAGAGLSDVRLVDGRKWAKMGGDDGKGLVRTDRAGVSEAV